jgi:hypothetical protein
LHLIIDLILFKIRIRFILCSFARGMGLERRGDALSGRIIPYRCKEIPVSLFIIF